MLSSRREAARSARIEMVGSDAGLASLRGEWERLWRHDPRSTPFQSPHWLLPWWKHVGAGRLATIAVRCPASGELVGLAPLYVHTEPGTRRRLLPIGIGSTDYLDLLARPEWQDTVAEALLAQAQCPAEWDVLEFPQLRADAPLLRAAARQALRQERVAGEPNPVLPLRADGNLPISKRMASNLRTCRNRAARHGKLRIEQASEHTQGEILAALQRLHAARWRARGAAGVLADAAVQAWHREALPLLHSLGVLRLYALRLGDECIAVLYALADAPGRPDRRCYYYIGGFDPAHAGLSPGTLLIAHAIEQATHEGTAAFDFLRGAEAYKYRWGAVDQPMFTQRLWPAHA